MAADDDDRNAAPSRILWKGGINFGLVHIPVALYTATSESSLDFDWLDKRSMEPVGYKRINKKTGQEIASADIVRGLKVDSGRYVILSNDEIKAAFPKTTQSIEIEGFVPAGEIPFVHLERPYYVAPIHKGEKVYALLREALIASNKVALAKVVIQSKQNLAVLIPDGDALVLNLLRWGNEIKPREELKLPPAGTQATGIKDAEMKMAQQLIAEMSTHWDAAQWRDSFRDDILSLVRRKEAAGEVQRVDGGEAAAEGGSAEIIDLTELLKRSLQAKGGEATTTAAPAAAPATEPAAPAKPAKAAAKTAPGKEAPKPASARPRKSA